MLAIPTGATLYVVGGLVLALAGVGGYAAYEHQAVGSAEKDTKIERAKTVAVTKERDDFSARLVQGEIDKAALAKDNADLDSANQRLQKRAEALAHDRLTISAELDALKAKLSKEDQVCLDRPLPPSLIDFLRNDGAGQDSVGPLHQSSDPPVAPAGLLGPPAKG